MLGMRLDGSACTYRAVTPRCWVLHLHSLTKVSTSFSLPLKASEISIQKHPLKISAEHSQSVLIAPISSVAGTRVPPMHVHIAYM